MTSNADNILDLYQRHAGDWDRERGRSLFEKPWLDRFLALLPAGGTVLDLGCGMGEPIARYVIEAGHPMTGIDGAPAMIDLCKARFPTQDWHVADMRDLVLGRRFDGVIAWDSFFHLAPDDQRRMFPVFRRHAARGAALLFTSGPAEGVAMGEYHGDPLYHASLEADEYRDLLAANGFAVIAHAVEDPTCGGHTIWLARSAGSL
jgi:SAM-dependent methyltransferase